MPLTERHYLLTMVVPIYLLSFACFRTARLAAHSVMWIRSYDCWYSDLAAQRLLQFNPQRHHVPFKGLLLHLSKSLQNVLLAVSVMEKGFHEPGFLTMVLDNRFSVCEANALVSQPLFAHLVKKK